MLVMLVAVLHAALLVPPLQEAPTGTGRGAPTPEQGGAVDPSAAPRAEPTAPMPTRAPITLPQPPADLPGIEPPAPLSAARVEALEREVSKLRAVNPVALKAAEGLVIAFGRSALPPLAKAATTNHPGQMEGLVVCMTTLADYRDRDFVEAALESPLPVMRRFAARKAGDYAIPRLLDKLPPLLEDKDEAVRLEATLALMANGREDGLTIAAQAFMISGKLVPGGPGGSQAPPPATPAYSVPPKERVLALLPRIADQGTHSMLEALLRIDPAREKEDAENAAKERLTAVMLLHAIGDVAAQTLLVKALDDKHNVVQREAINSLRDLLEHQGPLDKSSIFQQITEVKRLKDVWKAR